MLKFEKKNVHGSFAGSSRHGNMILTNLQLDDGQVLVYLSEVQKYTYEKGCTRAWPRGQQRRHFRDCEYGISAPVSESR